ncbi:MAG TPA: MFS transporter, partial [Microthrixaceae bacterium]|nr:MFS transporter [Microthrixaceae bacterium]
MATIEADPYSETYGIPPDVYHRRKAILAVLCLSLVIIVVAVSSLNVAIPTLQRELGATPTQLQWIIDSYALVFAGFLLPAGALGDRFGRKGALIFGLVVFGVCAGLASQATSPEMLIAMRAMAGLGAAFIMPATLSIVTNSFPVHERQKAIATWAGLAGAGGAIGPIVSGLLLEHFWWGSIFFVNIPLIALLLVLTVFIVPTSKDPAGHPLDPIGAGLSVVGLVALVFAIIEGPEWGWLSPEVLAVFATAAIFLVGFVVWELRTTNPTLDPRLFKLPGFGMGSLAICLSFFCMFGMFFLLTQYLQFVEGDSPLMAGVKTLPSAAVLVLISPRSPVIVGRLGVKHTIRLGYLCSALGFVGMALLVEGTPYWHFAVSIMLIAAGIGLVMPPATSSIISS